MKLLKTTSCCILLLGNAASAQDLVPYSEAGGWNIQIDPTLGNGCLLSADYEDSSHVRIGFDRIARNGYVAMADPAWGDIADGTDYPVSFSLDGEKYEGSAKGIHLDGVAGVVITFDSIDFLSDLATRQTMLMFYEGEEMMALDLSGSDAAISETIACQEAQEG